MEMSCQRRDWIVNSFHTEMKPAALSASSSFRISSISRCTSSQPRRLCRAEGETIRGHDLRAEEPETQGQERAATNLTSLSSEFIFLLNQEVAGALGKEGEEEELKACGDSSQTQENWPACKQGCKVTQAQRMWTPFSPLSELCQAL